MSSKRWEDVTKRNAAADGTFVFGVMTTKIYCRPSCPARRPLRSNVKFFDDVESAEAAGLRACKRCNPKGDQVSKAKTLALRICSFIENSETEPSLDDLARTFDMSPYHLQRTFTQVLGISPKKFAQSLRGNRLRKNLRENKSVTAAVFDSGFESLSTAYSAPSGGKLGMTPGDFRKSRDTRVVSYAISQCKLGWYAVAATAAGVCGVYFGDTKHGAKDELLQDFPLAESGEESYLLKHAASSIGQYLAGELAEIDLPLDVRATAFQAKVWDLLRKIPYGETRSYSQLASELGMPKGGRAVASACASNKAALAIPCHRVIHNDGTISGYRWGRQRKQALLQMEAKKARQLS